VTEGIEIPDEWSDDIARAVEQFMAGLELKAEFTPEITVLGVSDDRKTVTLEVHIREGNPLKEKANLKRLVNEYVVRVWGDRGCPSCGYTGTRGVILDKVGFTDRNYFWAASESFDNGFDFERAFMHARFLFAGACINCGAFYEFDMTGHPSIEKAFLVATQRGYNLVMNIEDLNAKADSPYILEVLVDG